MRSHAERGFGADIAARRRRSRRGRRVCRRRAASRHIPTPHLREGGCRARESRESAPGRAAHTHAHRSWPAWDQCAGLSGALGVGALASGELREARCRRSDFAGARVSSGSSAVVASRGGHPRAAGRRRGRATAWVWWYPREKGSQASVAARSTSISWPTFLRSHQVIPGSQNPWILRAFSSENCFQGSHRAISIWPAGRGRLGCWRGGPPPPRPDGGWPRIRDTSAAAAGGVVRCSA